MRGSESVFSSHEVLGTPETCQGFPSGVAVLILSSTSARVSAFRKNANGELTSPSRSIQVGKIGMIASFGY